MSMFSQHKPTASLSSALLARKGQAKPAMRPQGFGGFGSMTSGPDDLGWNDMGGDAPLAEQPHPAPILVPPVLVEREMLREEISVPPVLREAAPAVPRPLKPVSVPTATRFARETARKAGAQNRKAAFTLRLDQDRHLRLRIAAALNNASAQMLVTEALDQFLQTLPEVDALVAQLPPISTRTRNPR